MSQKQKLRLKAKEKIVKSYLAGEVSIRGAAAETDKEKAGGNRNHDHRPSYFALL